MASLGSVYLSVAGVHPAGGFGLILIAMAVLFGAVAVGSLWLLSTASAGAPAEPEQAIEL